MSAWFAAELTTLAFCWRLDRRDGVALGFTSHDRDLRMGGFLFRAAPGMVPSAIEQSSGLEADALSLSGAIISDGLSEADLVAGRWDGARLRLWAVDWSAPDIGARLLLSGELGAVEAEDRAFSVDLVGPKAGLDQPVTEATSPHCRARLGDTRCRADMAGRTHLLRVTGGAGRVLEVAETLMPDIYAFGALRWADGPQAGLSVGVLANDAHSVTLAGGVDVEIAPGLLVELTQGCDRRLATCAARFGNAINFRGEPHLPGNDVLMRYGG